MTTPATVQRMVRMQANGAEPYWWHAAILDEMEMLAEHDVPTMNAHGIASNLRGFYVGDTEKYLRQMIAAGVVSEAPAAWDFESLWVTLS